MLQKLIARFHAWREARQWEAQHIEWLRTMVHGDARWLASNPIAAAITERYEAALAEDWYARPHEDVSQLRTRLGLDPHAGQKSEASIYAQGYADGEKWGHLLRMPLVNPTPIQLFDSDDFPAPHWAVGRTTDPMQVGAQLRTRDGRRVGNAVTAAVAERTEPDGGAIAHVLTDVGTQLMLNRAELQELFYEPEWLMSTDEHLARGAALAARGGL